MTSVLEKNLDFKKSDTRYSTHGIHTWVAAMIPALAQKLIEKNKTYKLARSILWWWYNLCRSCIE